MRFWKRGEMGIGEIVKIVIVVLILALMVGVIIILLRGKGGETLDIIRNLLRFGKGS